MPRWEKIVLHDKIKTLVTGQLKEAIELYFVQGFSAEMASEMVGISAVTMENRIARVRLLFPDIRQNEYPELRGYGRLMESANGMKDKGVWLVRANHSVKGKLVRLPFRRV